MPHRDAVDFFADSARSDQQDWQRERLRESIEFAGRRLSENDAGAYRDVLQTLHEHIFPALDEYTSRPLDGYGRVLDDDLTWHWPAIRAVRRRPEQVFDALAEGDGRARQTVRQALKSASSAAAHENVVNTEYVNEVDAVGVSGKVGHYLKKPGMDLGDPVGTVTFQSGALKTLMLGGTGQGKSTALDMEVWDYYRANGRAGKNYKIIDIQGLSDGENWYYDIPQQQEPLTRIRDEMGLPPALDDSDDIPTPEIEILAPLTPELAAADLPYDEDDGFVVKPFTVPASDLSKPLLIALISALLTETQENAIRMAYDELNRNEDDWTLSDLADQIRETEDITADVKSHAVRALQSLQHQGFIRDRECPHAIDWDRIFTDSDTVTVFSMAHCQDAVAQFMTFGYAATAIGSIRRGAYGYPDCVLVMRELWQVTPHQRRTHDDRHAEALQKSIGQQLAETYRVNRKDGIHIIADTQKVGDLLKPVREMFNRYVVFQEAFKEVQKVFHWTSNSQYESFYSTLTPQIGHAGIVGQVEPAVSRSGIEYLSPIHYAPPPFHHWDEDSDTNGWQTRVKYTDEELRTPEDTEDAVWLTDLPPELEIRTSNEEEGYEPRQHPVKAFVAQSVQSGDRVEKEHVYKAYNAFRREHGLNGVDLSSRGRKASFSPQFTDAVSEVHGFTAEPGKSGMTRYFNGVELTPTGEDRRDKGNMNPSTPPQEQGSAD